MLCTKFGLGMPSMDLGPRLAKCGEKRPQKYYAYVQSKGSFREEVCALKLDENSVAVDESSNAKVLGYYFSSAHRMNAGFHRELNLQLRPSVMGGLQLMEGRVRLNLGNINNYKSAGPDRIHSTIIKPLDDILVGSTCMLPEATMQQGYLPRNWKSMAVVAVHRVGLQLEVSDHRLLSLTNILREVLEAFLGNACVYT